MKKKLLDASVWTFLLVGVGNTLLSLVLMFLLEGLGYWSSTAIAYVAGAVMSFSRGVMKVATFSSVDMRETR